MITYDKFRLSLARLRDQHQTYLHPDPSLPGIIQEAIAESVIQRFETCYDCLWKALKRYMEEEIGIADVPNSPKPILRRAFENDLLQGPLDKWFDYAKYRVGTSHDYSITKAEDCLRIVGDFIEDAIAVYKTMADEPWQ